MFSKVNTCLINLVKILYHLVSFFYDCLLKRRHISINFAIQSGSSWTDTGNEIKKTVIIPWTGRNFQNQIEYDNFLTRVHINHNMGFALFDYFNTNGNQVTLYILTFNLSDRRMR